MSTLAGKLRLDRARTRLISGFVDVYLRLNQQEEAMFQTELGKLEVSEREDVMQIVTSWMEQGIEQGERSLILRLLTRKVGEISETTRSQIEALSIFQLEALGEALLDFSEIADLGTWLQENPVSAIG